MKKEKDEITDLFRTRLADAGMTVRDGFWEQLAQDIPVACQHRRRLLVLRVAAAASVLLVLAASSATFWYFSPKEEIGEAFTRIAAVNGGSMDGDGVCVHPLLRPVEPVLSKPAPNSYGMLSQFIDDEDSVSITLSMSFSYSETTSVRHGGISMNQENRFCQVTGEGHDVGTAKEEPTTTPQLTKALKARRWAVKAQVGTALPADGGTYKMPVSAGLTVERQLNHYLGIETGLLYSNLRSAGQHLHYLGIPVKMNLKLFDTNKVDIYATVGGVADKCIAGAPNTSFRKEPIQLAVTAGVGINYKINDCLAFFLEPGVSHHFKTDSELATVRTKRSTNFNLLCGLRMSY